MRTLRYILRLIFALEAVGFLSLAVLTLRQSKVIAVFDRFHLGRHTVIELFCFILMLAILSALAALRIESGDLLGRWSLLAASIFNLPLIPAGTLVAIAGIFYFIRNPPLEPTNHHRHLPVEGDGTSRWSGAVFLGAQLVWGVFIVRLIQRWTHARGIQALHSEVLFWLILAVAVYASILFHEFGHLVLGDIVGFRPVGFTVGPVSLSKTGGHWRRQIRWDRPFEGATVMVPSKPRDIRIRAMVLTLGGPFASLLQGAIGTVCLLLIPGPAWSAITGQLVAMLTGLAFGHFIFNLLPMASETGYSDGARLWQMYRRGPWCDFHCANHYMGLSQTTTLRPRDWPTHMVERAAEFATQLPHPAGSFAMAYAHFMDKGEWQNALSWLEKAHLAAETGTKLAHALTIDRAFVEAFHRRDAGEAQRWFAQAPVRIDSTDYWRSAATVRAAQGDLVGATTAWNQAWELAQKRPATGIYDMDREQLRIVGAWLQELRVRPVSA